MFATYVVVTLLAAAANLYGASADFTRPAWIMANMGRLEIPESRLPSLGALKAAGGVGLLVGFAVPAIGLAAGVGLVLFFLGAIITVVRIGWYGHLPYPTTYLLLATASLTLNLAAS
jgi:hypothetical protein